MTKRAYTERPFSAPMSAAEYREAIAALGFASQHAAGAFLGVSPRTAQNYPLGATRVPLAAAKLLRLMIRRGIAPADLT